MTRIWWVRHAPTHLRILPPPDAAADLSDTAALGRLAAYLPDVPVIASPLRRARATAVAIARGRPRWPDDPDLRECDYGEWAGLGWDAICARWPDLSRRYLETPGDAAPPAGESWNDAAARVGAVADRLVAQGDCIAVAHHGVILTQVARALGLTPQDVLAQPIAPLSVTCLAWVGDTWRAESINHIL